MLKTVLVLAGAMLAMQQGGNTNDQGLPGIRYDTGVDGERRPNFTGGVSMRPEAGRYDTPPAWIREPTPARIGAAFPAQAIRTSQDGVVDMKCRLTVDGALSGCVVEREAPAGLGFGAVARSLTADFNLRPAHSDGRPVASNVAFKITFTGPGSASIASKTGVSTMGSQRFLATVGWTAAPSYEQVVAAYPAAARAANRGGRATLDCVFGPEGALKTCDISNEEPAGMGFGEAAKLLAQYFRAPAATATGASIEGVGVVIPVTFSERMLQPGNRATGRPALSMMPSNVDFGRAYPAQARQASVMAGDALIDCAIAAGGALSGCTVARETPSGMGFGAAALSLAPKFQVNPWSAEGLPVVGGRIRVPVRYALKAGA